MATQASTPFDDGVEIMDDPDYDTGGLAPATGLTPASSSARPDINNPQLQREPILIDGVDPEEFQKPPLCDDGPHLATLGLGDRGIQIIRRKDKQTGQRTGDEMILMHLVATLADSDPTGPNMPCFDNVTSVAMRDGISSLHIVLAIAGMQVSKSDDLPTLQRKAEVCLAQSPRVKVITEWEAQVEDQSKPEGSRDRYRVVKVGQKNFPPILDSNGKETGKYNPEIKDPQTGQTVRARVRIKSYARA